MRFQNYNWAKGWEGTNPGWHTVVINNADFDGHYSVTKFEEKYQEIIQWLYDNIDNCERHVRWILEEDSINVRFRFEKDYSWFMLRWGQMITIKLKNRLLPQEEQWLAKNVGPRLHWLPNSIGGQGWVAKNIWKSSMVEQYWTLTFEDDKLATWFTILFPQ